MAAVNHLRHSTIDVVLLVFCLQMTRAIVVTDLSRSTVVIIVTTLGPARVLAMVAAVLVSPVGVIEVQGSGEVDLTRDRRRGIHRRRNGGDCAIVLRAIERRLTVGQAEEAAGG